MYKLVMAFFLVLVLISCKEKQQQQQQQQQPNVIFILTDQWRASALGYAGNDVVKTPKLDEFARSAVNFKNAVSVTPVCTPYRAALLTGRYPTSTGMFINDLYLPAEELTLAEIYKSAGYQTAYLGKWHLDGHGRKDFVAPERRQGFDFWKGSECDHNYQNEHYYDNLDTIVRFWEGYSTNAISKEAQSYMEVRSTEENPFLLFVSLGTPHFPHETAPDKFMRMYPKDKLKLPENVTEDMKEWAYKELQGYYAHCTASDKAIGEIIDKAKELGIYDNSIIVFTSDHGEMMGSHGFRPYMKHQPYSESANVPFLISYPGMKSNQGKIAEAAITTPDILPSLLALSNINIPESIEGYDLSGIVKEPERDADRAALYMNVCPFGIAFPTEEYRAVRTSAYTYVKTPDGPSMLFNHNRDVLQLNNLVNHPDYQEVVQKLDKQLMAELARIGESGVPSRDFYLEKFDYKERPQFRADYHIKNVQEVDVVVSPQKIK